MGKANKDTLQGNYAVSVLIRNRKVLRGTVAYFCNSRRQDLEAGGPLEFMCHPGQIRGLQVQRERPYLLGTTTEEDT